MKKILFLLLLSASILIISCKSNKPKELIVNKWKITDISVPNMSMPDSIKNNIKNGTMEFTKDGKLSITGMGNDQYGTYTLTEDGKTLTTITNGKTEASDVNELSKSKMVISSKANGSKVVLEPR